MKYLEKFNFFKKKGEYITNSSESGEWMKYFYNDITLHIQYGANIKKAIVDEIMNKISNLSIKYYLIDNSATLYVKRSNKRYSHFIKFSIADSEGDPEDPNYYNKYKTIWGPIPSDIQEDMIKTIGQKFTTKANIPIFNIECFGDRGYLHVDVVL